MCIKKLLGIIVNYPIKIKKVSYSSVSATPTYHNKVTFGGTPSLGFAHPSINVVPATLPFSNLSKKVLLEEKYVNDRFRLKANIQLSNISTFE